MHSTNPEKYFKENTFFEKNNFSLFSDYERKNYGLIANIFRHGCHNCFLPVPTKYLRFPKNFSERERNWGLSGKNAQSEYMIYIRIL